MTEMSMMPIEWIELLPDDLGMLMHPPNQAEVPHDSTVAQALTHLGWAPSRIASALQTRSVAVFGLYAKADTLLQAYDRLEFLAPLPLDPKERRNLLNF